jgi:hypothetical protein
MTALTITKACRMPFLNLLKINIKCVGTVAAFRGLANFRERNIDTIKFAA